MNAGTHIFKTIELGGIIEGTIVSDKCSVSGTFESDEEYLICLNAQYKGSQLDECQISDNNSMSAAFAFKRITASGGEIDTFVPVLNAFSDGEKLDAFNNWTNSLSLSNYHVVGGNVDGIWNVIENAVDLGNHTLNVHASKTLSDDEWRAIATAMESAFDDYSEELIAEHNSVHDCDGGAIDCHGAGQIMLEDCVCGQCSSAAVCCGLEEKAKTDESGLSQIEIVGLAVSAVSLLICVCGLVMYCKMRGNNQNDCKRTNQEDCSVNYLPFGSI